MLSLKGKVAAISGSASGIGYQVARAYAEAGASIAMFYNSNKEAVTKAEALSNEFDVQVKAYHMPLHEYETVEAGINKVVDEFGKLDIVVANSATRASGNIIDMPVDLWISSSNINFSSVFYIAKAAGAIFKKQGHGNMIITSSISGHIVNIPRNQAGYNSQKAAIRHLAKSLAVDFKDFARVNSVSPGYVKTDLSPRTEVLELAYQKTALGRQADAREIKGVYLFLASDASSFMTGSDIIIDGGYTLP